MNRALFFLWSVLLRKKVVRFLLDLRQPFKLIGVLAPLSLVGFLFYHRDHEIFGHLVKREAVIGVLLLMLAGSVFKGFLQRGMVFEPADVEFLFTGPFAQRQIVLYRLLPNYLYAVIQGVFFLGLFAPHLEHPVLATVSLIFFQVLCFHVATVASIFAGSIPLPVHDRIRWMMLGFYFVLTAVYLRVSFGIDLVPSFFKSDAAQLLFYPAVTTADLAGSPDLRQLTMPLTCWLVGLRPSSLIQSIGLILFAAGAAASWLFVVGIKASVFEASVSTTERVTERRRKIQRGQHAVAISSGGGARTSGLPTLALFQGAGALIWKNLVRARRCRRQLALAAGFTLIFTLPLLLMLKFNNDMVAQNLGADDREILEFHAGIAIFVGFLAFLLQRSFPFDFRADGQHLVGFRTLPMSSWAIVLAEIAVPTVLILAFQGAGILSLIVYGQFSWTLILMIVLLYPALSLGVTAVWNTHYLISATKHVSQSARPQSASAVGTLVVVGLSCAVFFPATWAAQRWYEHRANPHEAVLAFVAIQYVVDFLLLQNLARLFQRFEIARES